MRSKLSLTVLVCSEEHDLVVVSLVSFGSFKQFESIIKSGIHRVKEERFVRLNYRVLPSALFFDVVNFKHVIGRNAAENILVILVWLWLQVLSLVDFRVHTEKSLSSEVPLLN